MGILWAFLILAALVFIVVLWAMWLTRKHPCLADAVEEDGIRTPLRTIHYGEATIEYFPGSMEIFVPSPFRLKEDAKTKELTLLSPHMPDFKVPSGPYST